MKAILIDGNTLLRESSRSSYPLFGGKEEFNITWETSTFNGQPESSFSGISVSCAIKDEVERDDLMNEIYTILKDNQVLFLNFLEMEKSIANDKYELKEIERDGIKVMEKVQKRNEFDAPVNQIASELIKNGVYTLEVAFFLLKSGMIMENSSIELIDLA